MRLIDADKVAEAIDWLNEYDFVLWNEIMKCIDKVPEVDAVPVVRCDDCIYRDGKTPGQPNIIDVIDEQPTVDAVPLEEQTVNKLTKALADAEPVRHGRWIRDRLVSTSGGTYGVYRCSVCEWYGQDIGYSFDYCPNCGAKMDEVENG